MPRTVSGFDEVKWLVIDDGSADRTAEVARECGADYVLRLDHHQCLARAFLAGLDFGLRLGADVIINTDADNQCDASCIPDLVRPIAEDHMKIVIGVRPIEEIESFSLLKKILQRLGSWAVRVVSRTDISDVTSGFRAFQRDTAIQLMVFGNTNRHNL